MTPINGTLQMPPVGVCQRTRILTQSLILLTIFSEVIAILCRIKTAALLTVYNALGPGP